MLKNGKIRKYGAIISVGVAVLTIALVACFVFLNELPKYKYSVFVPDTGSVLAVTLEITNPVFSKTDAVSLLVGDKQIEIYSCIDASGQATGDPLLDEGVLFIATGRGSKTYLTYGVGIATPGKHGNRGGISDNYALFDGEQAMLFPVSCYNYKPGSDHSILMSEISLEFDLPEGWEQITPKDPVKNPRWADIYAIQQDAFVFGEFTKMSNTLPNLNMFVLSDEDPASQETLDGLNNLYTYYSELFGSTPNLYNIVTLPKPDDDALQVIGGAGTGSVAASFDPNLLRDWQLLSHRMFHAFFDSAAPYASFHMPSNTWFYEGMATYYENNAMDALPDLLKAHLDVDVNREMALMFDKYLYMRIKDPMIYGFPPMSEDELASKAAIEFLHYTASPLLVKLLEEEALKKGVQPDAMLKYCVENGASFEERFIAFEVAIELLGEEDAGKYIESYLLSVEVPPLWDLKEFQPSDEAVLEALNDIENLLGTWLQENDETYYINTVTYAQLKKAMENLDEQRALFASVETSAILEDFCPPLYALLNDYYYTANQKGISYDDPNLHYKIFADEADSE